MMRMVGTASVAMQASSGGEKSMDWSMIHHAFMVLGDQIYNLFYW